MASGGAGGSSGGHEDEHGCEGEETSPPPRRPPSPREGAGEVGGRTGVVRRLRGDALLSGALGATASCLAKVALDPDSAVPSLVRTACQYAVGGRDHAALTCWAASLVPRGVALVLMVGTNAMMMGAFLDGMDESGSVAGVALSSAANFSVSALYGILLFGETVTPRWAFGFSLVIAGVWMLSGVRSKKDKSD